MIYPTIGKIRRRAVYSAITIMVFFINCGSSKLTGTEKRIIEGDLLYLYLVANYSTSSNPGECPSVNTLKNLHFFRDIKKNTAEVRTKIIASFYEEWEVTRQKFPAKDLWGNQYIIECRKDNGIVTTSPGPDGKIRTEDDISISDFFPVLPVRQISTIDRIRKKNTTREIALQYQRAERFWLPIVRNAVRSYRISNKGKCPTASDLVEDGYLFGERSKTDPWGKSVIIKCNTNDDEEITFNGADGKNGTLDDIPTSDNLMRLDFDTQLLSGIIQEILLNKQNKCPLIDEVLNIAKSDKTIKDLKINMPSYNISDRDPWGNKYVIDCRDGINPHVFSSGKDGKAGTTDDVYSSLHWYIPPRPYATGKKK